MTDDGAIDHDFDDAEREADAVLAENVGSYNRRLSKCDVAIDLVTGQPVYVVGLAAASVVAYMRDKNFDLLTYKFHPYLPIADDDAVFECVYIPTNAQDLIHPDKSGRTYSFPAGRLARVAVEDVSDHPRPHDDLTIDAIESVLRHTGDGDEQTTVVPILRRAFDGQLVAEAQARAGVDTVDGDNG